MIDLKRVLDKLYERYKDRIDKDSILAYKLVIDEIRSYEHRLKKFDAKDLTFFVLVKELEADCRVFASEDTIVLDGYVMMKKGMRKGEAEERKDGILITRNLAIQTGIEYFNYPLHGILNVCEISPEEAGIARMLQGEKYFAPRERRGF